MNDANKTVVVDVPIFYQVEAILKGKRKPRMYTVLSMVPMEIQETDMELLSLCMDTKSETTEIYPSYKSDLGVINPIHSTKNLIGNSSIFNDSTNNFISSCLKVPELTSDYQMESYGGMSFTPDDFETLKHDAYMFICYVANGMREFIGFNDLISEDELGDARKVLSDNKKHALSLMTECMKKVVVNKGLLYELVNMPKFAVNMPAGLLNRPGEGNVINLSMPEVTELEDYQSLYFPIIYPNVLKKYIELNNADRLKQQEEFNDEHYGDKEYYGINMDKAKELENTYGPPERIYFDTIKRIQSVRMPYSRSGATSLLRKMGIHDVLKNGERQNYNSESVDNLFMFYENVIDSINKSDYRLNLDDDEILYITECYDVLKNLRESIKYHYDVNPKDDANLFVRDDYSEVFVIIKMLHNDEINDVTRLESDDTMMPKII